MRAAADFTIARLAATERLCTTNVSVANYLPERKGEVRWGGGARPDGKQKAYRQPRRIVPFPGACVLPR